MAAFWGTIWGSEELVMVSPFVVSTRVRAEGGVVKISKRIPLASLAMLVQYTPKLYSTVDGINPA